VASALALNAGSAHAELGQDLERVKQAWSGQTRSEALKPRWLERGDVIPIVVPPWSIDTARGNCTSIVIVAAPSTQFVLHLHPWPGLPSAVASSAGALQVTRCEKDRVSLLDLRLEMRSPRAMLYARVAVGRTPPASLASTLPARLTGPASPSLDPGPAPPRESLAARLAHFEAAAAGTGAGATESARLAAAGPARISLEPGCHRLLATAEDPSPRGSLLITEGDDTQPLRVEPDDNGDARYELCTLRTRRLQIALEAEGEDVEETLAFAHYGLPSGLPERLGPELGERLLQALGGSTAPRKLGSLVFASLGAQGLTPMPQSLLPGTCYVAAVVTVHGSAQTLSLGARAGATHVEADVASDQPGAHVGFCTGTSPLAVLEVEARGIGVAWLVTLFQTTRARAEGP
jgi:hypothetical protein